jgi:hypothetical protein
MGALMLTQTGIASATSPGASGSATAPIPVTVGAQITGGGGGGNPTIECSWIVGDHNPAGGSETDQYSYAVGRVIDPGGAAALKNLTLSTQTPNYSGTGPTPPSFSNNADTGTNFYYLPDGFVDGTAPCSLPAGASSPTMAAGTDTAPTSSGASFTPYPFDNGTTDTWNGDPGPNPLRLELWTAADYATSVIFDVFYPEAHASGVFNNSTEDTELGGVPEAAQGAQACSNYATSGSLLDSMGAAALADNEISSAAWFGGGVGLIDHCNKGEKQFWHQAFIVSKDDPSGLYTVEVRATSSSGTSTSWFSFNINTLTAFAVDFTSVLFTNDNGNYLISGDEKYDTSKPVACDTEQSPSPLTTGSCNGPTVISGGNEGLQMGIAFTPLLYAPTGSQYYLQGPVFDANLGYNGTDGIAGTGPGGDLTVNAGTSAGVFGPTTWLTAGSQTGATATGAQVVCPNDSPELDLSLHPPTGTVSNTGSTSYSGSMEVLAEPDQQVHGGCLTDNGAPYVVTEPNSFTESNGYAVTPGSLNFKTVLDQDAPTLTRTALGS